MPGQVWLGAVVVLCLNLGLVFTYYNKSWTPGDDGHYIHVSDRLLGGDLLHRDVEELHPGYVHLVNVLALRTFGRDLVSLRIPLMAMAVVQSLILFAMFSARGIGAGIVAAMTVSGIGVFQVATPLTGLYTLFLTVLILAVLHWIPPDRPSRLVWAGFLLALMFLFRQLSAVFVAMGVLTYLLLEHRDTPLGHRVAARSLLGIMSVGLGAYLLSSTDPSGIVLIGIWPLGVMVGAWRRVRMRDAEVLRTLFWIAAGGVVAFVPLVGYHLYHESVGYWIRDAFVRSLSVTDLEHIARGRYYFYLIPGFLNIFSGASASIRINGLYWSLLPLLTVMNGLAVWHMVIGRRLKLPDGAELLPVMAIFHGLVSLFNQIPLYLYLTAGLSGACFLWWSPYRWKRTFIPNLLAVFLVVVGIAYHAAQPYSRGLEGVVEGTRVDLAPSGLERASIWMDPVEAGQYRELVEVIQRETAPDEPIFAPNQPEVYFLSDRRNPFRIFYLNLSLLDDAEVERFLEEFRHARVPLLVYDTESLSGGPSTRGFLAAASKDYRQIASIGPFRVLRRSVR